MRASSANQISIATGSMPFSCAISSRRAGKFFYIVDGAHGLRLMARTGREFAIVHLAQLAAQGLLGGDDAKFLEQPLAKVDDPPTYDAMDRRRRTLLDHARERRAVLAVEPGRLSGRLTVDQPVRAKRVEAQNPVAHDLDPDPADLRANEVCRLAASLRLAPS